MLSKMAYRLALDLGSTSLGWAMIRLNADQVPYAVIRAGVRIFPDGRNPKDGSSLAVTRRAARAMRRRRDRLLKRKVRMMRALIEYGFFPTDDVARKALETSNPYELRARGLDEALSPEEFGRVLFHINQRRGFKSNRKTDRKESDSGALKDAIRKVKDTLCASESRTVGEWLYKRMMAGETVRARYRELKVVKEDGKSRIDKSYDLYIDRALVEAEFDTLWQAQSAYHPALFTEQARHALKDTLLYQRALKPVKPGRCTLLPNEERAPLALPGTQRFRIYQELNHLRILDKGLQQKPLTLEQRNILAAALEENGKRTFTQIRKLLGLSGAARFNVEDDKRQELKGNATSVILSKADRFGCAWFAFSEQLQDAIVLRLVKEENETELIQWLQTHTGIDAHRAETIANISLPEGYGAFSIKALDRIVPELKRDVITYDKAVKAAGFEHHSALNPAATGQILPELPYYGQPLQRHVGFGTGNPADSNEKRYGRIANPTVHIGLNQVRLVVNALIQRYGHPSEVVIELARELKQSRERREDENKRQADNQKRNKRLRSDIANLLRVDEEHVKTTDLHKMMLWEELSSNAADRRCPYSGVQISPLMLLSDEVEIEHILPFSRTLDDSLNNKTVALRQANRMKGNLTPWEAFGRHPVPGFDYQAILQRAQQMPKGKRYRFGEEGYQEWLRNDRDFLARALNDTRYLSRVAHEYLRLICPDTRAIPGQMTAMLRRRFGLDRLLGAIGEKNRNDHRHHAIDACVVGVTDQRLMQRFAQASASARERQLNRLVDDMPLPWSNYQEHVRRAVERLWISHKPDHSHEGAMHNDTAYGLLGNGRVGVHKRVNGKREYVEDNLKVIEFANAKAIWRHGSLPDGQPKPYKGYKGDSNYCIEIVRSENGKWEGEVISTFSAYQVACQHGVERLRHPALSISEKPLVMRLMIDDTVRMEHEGEIRTMRVAKISSNGQIFMSDVFEANADARNRDANDSFSYVSKMAGSLNKSRARRVTISPIGELNDPGYRA